MHIPGNAGCWPLNAHTCRGTGGWECRMLAVGMHVPAEGLEGGNSKDGKKIHGN